MEIITLVGQSLYFDDVEEEMEGKEFGILSQELISNLYFVTLICSITSISASNFVITIISDKDFLHWSLFRLPLHTAETSTEVVSINGAIAIFINIGAIVFNGILFV